LKSERNGLSILHLTDIHAGPGEIKDADIKTSVPGISVPTLLQRLTSYLEALQTPPAFVILSGDVCNRANAQGMDQCRRWLIGCIEKRILPPATNVMITPGNHDVAWGFDPSPESDRLRYGKFFESFATTFPHAHLPHFDPPLDHTQPNISIKSPRLIGGLKTRLRFGQPRIVSSHPFLLDLKRDILIFGFNSSLGCGSRLPADPDISKPLDSLIALHTDVAIKRPLEVIKEAYDRSRIVDAPYVGFDQLDYFSALMKRLQRTLGAKYRKLTKIATLHHHLTHIWRQQLEVKAFDAPLDAAQLRQWLVEYDFDIVLHGHKHTNHVSIDSRLAPVAGERSYGPLSIVSGGTVGGAPRLSDTQSFKLLRLDGGNGPRRGAQVVEVPLLETGEPASVIRSHGLVYQLPIADRLPALHDSASIKARLDSQLRAKLAPELSRPGALVHSGGQSMLPPADPDLVAAASHYSFDSILEEGAFRVFYDVILAIERLGFRQRARVYWMLRDVKALSAQEGFTGRVKLLIGNLQDTGFGRNGSGEEIDDSIYDLKRQFAPAVASGLLEIRVLRLMADELDELPAEVLR